MIPWTCQAYSGINPATANDLHAVLPLDNKDKLEDMTIEEVLLETQKSLSRIHMKHGTAKNFLE